MNRISVIGFETMLEQMKCTMLDNRNNRLEMITTLSANINVLKLALMSEMYVGKKFISRRDDKEYIVVAVEPLSFNIYCKTLETDGRWLFSNNFRWWDIEWDYKLGGESK